MLSRNRFIDTIVIDLVCETKSDQDCCKSMCHEFIGLLPEKVIRKGNSVKVRPNLMERFLGYGKYRRTGDSTHCARSINRSIEREAERERESESER